MGTSIFDSEEKIETKKTDTPTSWHYCPKCGEKIKQEASFCTQCGFQIVEKSDTTKDFQAVSKKKAPSKTKGVISRVVGIIFILIAIAVGRYLGQTLGILYIFLLIPGLAGYYLPKYYINKPRFIRFLAWSNVITWLLPFAGLYTAISTLKTASSSKKKVKYETLGIIGLSLSVINCLLGVYISSLK